MSTKKPKKVLKRATKSGEMEVRVKFNKNLTDKVDVLVRKLSFGSRPELVRQATREFVLKHEDLLKE